MNDGAHIKRERQSPKIAVYAIAHNEEHHVERWAASARDADQIVLVDTGSTDRTVQRARELGVAVHEIRIEPFRYDVARNRALAFVPGDIDFCVSLDLDEVLAPGWRTHLEDAWHQGATRVRFRYVWPWSDVHPPCDLRAWSGFTRGTVGDGSSRCMRNSWRLGTRFR